MDFVTNFYDYGICDSFVKEARDYSDTTEIRRRLPYFIVYKIMGALPLCFLSVFIIISLLYRAFHNLLYFIRSMKSLELKRKLIENSKDSCFCKFFNVDDDNEVIFSKCDLMYVIEILKPTESEELTSEIGKIKHNKKELKNMENSFIKVKSKNESKIVNLFRKHIYDWNPNFHFTSRFINTIVVANVALYFVFLYCAYYITMFVTFIAPSKLKYLVDVDNSTLNIGKLLNFIDYETNNTIDHFVQVPEQIAKFLPIFRRSIIYLFVVPVFGAMVICILQMFLLIKESKNYLIELYKGKCEFVKKPKSINQESVFTSSFHFGGSAYILCIANA